MKLYTKTGDKGSTSLFGGERVKKFDLRLETYGSIDELNSFIGLLRSELQPHPELKDIDLLLYKVQNNIFNIGSYFATANKELREKLPPLSESIIKELENEMDEQDKKLPALKEFILPGGHKVASISQVARTLCRRAERRAVELNEQDPQPELALIFLNRLSDYFFSLSRYINFKFEFSESPWKKGLE